MDEKPAKDERPDVSVVIPVWGRVGAARAPLASLIASLRGVGGRCETVVAVAPAHAHVRPWVEAAGAEYVGAPGSGYGEVLRAGLERASAAVIVTMDPDLSHPVEYVRKMWDARHDADVVIGSRWVAGARVEMRAARRVLSRFVNRLYRGVLSLPYRDVSSGLRLFHRRVLQDIGAPRARGVDALPEMVVKSYAQGWRIVELPFAYRPTAPWTGRRFADVGLAFVRSVGKLFGLRNSVRAADYDDRAFDSWIPLQRYWQRRRFRIVRGFLQDAGRVLDIGCGTSRIVQSLPDVVGTDLAIRKLRWLRARRPGVRLLQADMNRLPFRDGAFDALLCSEVIEHVPREAVRLSELQRVVRPGGTVVVGTPDYGRVRWRVIEWLYGTLFPGGYASEHINRYTNAELRSQLEGSGIEILECRYVGGSEMIFKGRVRTSRRSLAAADA